LNIAIEQEHAQIAEELRTMTLQLENISLDARRGRAIQALWKSESIQKAFERSNEFQIDDGANIFFDKLEEIWQPDYIPSTQDVLNVRIKTTGLKETQFPCKGKIVKIVDVGGQRSERRKWIHCFQDVTAILYIVALNDYERVLEEDEETNRMKEALELFEQVVTNRYFTETPTVLFMNKKDLFDKRIKVSPLNKYFPDYTGPNEYDPCIKYFREKFMSINKSPKKQFYSHETCATDTKNIEVVWNAVRDIILTGTMDEMGVGAAF